MVLERRSSCRRIARNLFPVVTMYHEGEINAIFFAAHLNQVSIPFLAANEWDKMCKNTCDTDCDFPGVVDSWSTAHIYFRDHTEVTCPSELHCSIKFPLRASCCEASRTEDLHAAQNPPDSPNGRFNGAQVLSRQWQIVAAGRSVEDTAGEGSRGTKAEEEESRAPKREGHMEGEGEEEPTWVPTEVASSSSSSEADVVLVPYASLVNAEMRSKLGIRVEGNVVLFDEAHNLLEAINEANSVSLTAAQVRSAVEDLARYAKHYEALEVATVHEAQSDQAPRESCLVAMTESDDVDNMTEGKYVYWMGIDDDIPRGHLGEIVEVLDEPYRRTKFPQGTWKLKAHSLNVSDFQKRTFVHCPGGDYDFEVIGEILDLDEGELIVEIMGEKVKKPPKKLVKCDFQPGMYVFWTKSDDDIPPGHMGTVLPDLNEEGMVKVKFPNGAWRFTPKQMVRGHIQHGSYVQWTKHDEDIAKGEIGEVFGELNDEGKVKVRFAKGCWRFDPESLFLHEMQLGCFVTWSKHDDDVEKGAVGHVIGIKVDEGRLRVQFPKGRWTFKANMLKLHKVQPGMLVHWACSDADIPRGDIGEVVRMKDEMNRMGVMWPKGNFSIKPKELRMLPFQKGDRVQWTSADDDIPEGDLGIVMGISYEGDESGNRLMVKWTKGRWNMKPEGLKATNLDADSINQLKAAFKRFDKNGDGKLTVE
ncbi:chl1, partial [Symbiodinium natans]